jgi:Asp-tRNA(Asn)/Glu-tRNA(Gln) amidotransferase C subunit
VDTQGAEPLQAPGARELPLRADLPRPGLSHEQALAPAPRTLQDGFAVPAIMDEG